MALSSSYLDAFLTVSQTLNFTQAAEKLHITQSALSQRVLNLEKELETTLFIRDRAGLRLTEAAHELLKYCKIKNALEEEYLNALRTQNSEDLGGSLRLGGFSSVMSSVVLKSIAPLIKKHPRLKLQLITKEIDELFGLLKRGEIDYMILDNRTEREELERVSLGVEKNFLVQKKNYAGGEIYLDHDEADGTTLNYLRKAKRPVKNLERLYLDDIHGLIEGAKLGLGRAVLPLHLIQGEKDLEIVSPKDGLEFPVYLYYFSQPYYPKSHHELVRSLKEGFAKYLGGA